jgi:hypothetical protein
MRKRPQHVSDTGEAQPATPQDLLRQLARTQKLEGCWDEDVEHTAIALLCFLRQGQTTTRGSFRVAIQRASQWLRIHPAAGLAELLRMLALVDLERTSGSLPDALTWIQNELKPNLSADETSLLTRLLAGESLSITSDLAHRLPPQWVPVWQVLVDQP